MRLHITLEGYNDPHPERLESTLDDFLDANKDTLDDEEIAQLRALRVGDKMTFGGGAAPLATVVRLA